MVVAPTIYLTSARAANSPLLAKLSERLQSSGSTVVNANAVRKDAVEDDRPAYLRRQAWMDDSQLVVADAGSGDASVGAEVYYALHKARVPALCLVPRGEPVPAKYAIPEEELPEEVVVAPVPPKQRINLAAYETEMLQQQSNFMKGFNGISPTTSIGHSGKKMYAARPQKAGASPAAAPPAKKSMRTLKGLSSKFGLGGKK